MRTIQKHKERDNFAAMQLILIIFVKVSFFIRNMQKNSVLFICVHLQRKERKAVECSNKYIHRQ